MKRKINVDIPIVEGASLECYYEYNFVKGEHYYYLWPVTVKVPKGYTSILKSGKVLQEGELRYLTKKEGILVINKEFIPYDEMLGRILIERNLINKVD